MKKRLKVLSLFLCIVLAVCGCGSAGGNDSKDTEIADLISNPAVIGSTVSETGLTENEGNQPSDDQKADKKEKAARDKKDENKNGGSSETASSKDGENSSTGNSGKSTEESGNGGTSSSDAFGNSAGPGKSPGGSSEADKNTSGKGSSSGENSGSHGSTSDQKKPEKKNITVTISVDCKTAVNKGYDIAKAISSSGTILGSKSMTLKKGATVYDALKQTGLVIGSGSSAMGMYVYSIQSLAEKACGSGSGWLYIVNGSFPKTSCSSYTLKDGDRVKWRYTCDDGKDM